MTLRAIIYLAGRRARRRIAECLAHVERRDYRLNTLINDDTAGLKFGEVLALLNAGEADVVVVPSLRDLPPDRVPRIDPLDELPIVRRADRPPVRRRRPRRVA